MWCFLFIGLFLLPNIAHGKRDCKVKLENNGFSNVILERLQWKEPVLTPPSKSNYLNDGKSVTMQCENGYVVNNLPATSLNLQCTDGSYNKTFTYYDLLCKSDYHKNTQAVRISPTMMGSKIFKCNGKNLELYQITAKQSDGNPKVLYLVCLDTKVMRPKFTYQPSKEEKPPRALQHEERNDVWGFDGFGKHAQDMITISRGYVAHLQRNITTKAFSNKYSSGKQYPFYFNRGHLVPYSDFTNSVDKKATCEYINAAPQWDAFNKNSWSLIEREARYLRQKNTKDWEIYTGTFGSIPTTSGPLYLASVFERGNAKKQLLPVPMLYWKLIHNLSDKTKSKAYVGVNNPEINAPNLIEKKYKICEPIQKPNRPLFEGSEFFGFTYECKVDDFLKALKNEEDIIKESFFSS